MSSEPAPTERKGRPVTILRRDRDARAIATAILRGRCPRCQQGRIFTGRWHMAPVCEICGLRFEREPGYFTGAMYVSYMIALPIFLALLALVWLVVSSLSFDAAIGVAVLLFLPFVPFVFRTSRILWIHFDRTIDAEE